MSSFVERLFQPGTSSATFVVFNVSILSLLGFVSYLYFIGIANVHVLIMSFLAVGLLASVNLLVYAVGLEDPNRSPEEPKVSDASTKKDN